MGRDDRKERLIVIWGSELEFSKTSIVDALAIDDR